MSDGADDSLTRWIVGAVAAAVLTVLGFLTKFVFSGVFKRLDELKIEVKTSNDEQYAKISKIADEVAESRTARAITELRLGHLEKKAESRDLLIDDMRRFMSTKGFKKREGPEGESGDW